MTNLAELPETPDYEAIKAEQKIAWSAGDYSKIGVKLQLTGEELAEAMTLRCGSQVLDVAAGNGNATLAMARRWHDVISTDYVDELLDKGRARAEAEDLDVSFQNADAENLPFKDGTFDGVVSTFGVMFAPDQLASAYEMNRVCKSGGKIGLANWTPDGFMGQIIKTISEYVPLPEGVASPTDWGTEAFINEQFGPDAAEIEITVKPFYFRYYSPLHFVDFFRTWYGPMNRAFMTLDPQKQQKLRMELIKVVERFNTATDGTAVISSDYAEIVVLKK